MNSVSAIRRLPTLILIGLIAGGCSRHNEDKLTAATGRVSIDSRPLDDGTIEFKPTDGITPPVIAKIQQGIFKTRLPKGSMKVVISATKKVGEKPVYRDEANSPVVDIEKETIPAIYNTKSTLVLDVADQPIDVEYKLKLNK